MISQFDNSATVSRQPNSFADVRFAPSVLKADFRTASEASPDTTRRQLFLGVGGSGRSPLECVFLEAGLGAACMGNSTSAPLGLVPGLVTSYARKCFTERIDNWKLSLWNSTRYTGTVSHLRLGARYYLGRSSVSRAYRLASNHIRPLHRHQRSDTSSVSEAP